MKLECGINLGGYLSQCKHERDHYESFIQEGDLKQIADLTMFVFRLITRCWNMRMVMKLRKGLVM